MLIRLRTLPSLIAGTVSHFLVNGYILANISIHLNCYQNIAFQIGYLCLVLFRPQCITLHVFVLNSMPQHPYMYIYCPKAKGNRFSVILQEMLRIKRDTTRNSPCRTMFSSTFHVMFIAEIWIAFLTV